MAKRSDTTLENAVVDVVVVGAVVVAGASVVVVVVVVVVTVVTVVVVVVVTIGGQVQLLSYAFAQLKQSLKSLMFPLYTHEPFAVTAFVVWRISPLTR